jgi:hypothetical protein
VGGRDPGGGNPLEVLSVPGSLRASRGVAMQPHCTLAVHAFSSPSTFYFARFLTPLAGQPAGPSGVTGALLLHLLDDEVWLEVSRFRGKVPLCADAPSWS